MTNREKAELTYKAIQERKMRKANQKLISDVKKVIGKNSNGFKLEYKFKRSYLGEIYWETRKDIELSETHNKRWGIEVIGNIYENPELLEGDSQ